MLQKKFNIGQKVWLKHDKQEAVVSDNADNDIIYVIADDMEIPVFAEDVDTNIPSLEPTIEQSKEKEKEQPVTNANEEKTEVNIAFEPLKNGEEIKEFKIWFINAPVKSDKIKYTLYEREDLFFTHTFKASPNEIIFLHTLEFDQLNESPEIELQISEGEKTVQKNIRIKPKNFFNKLTFVQQLNNEAYVFSFGLDAEKKEEQNYQQFEVNHDRLRYSMQAKPNIGKTVLHNHPAERVVDLHIEKITKDYKKLSNNEIVEIQLNYFQKALNAALHSHLDHMYVIHGLGKGVLKNRVFDILKTYTGIKEFKNEYHPRFGWGATEIIFK